MHSPPAPDGQPPYLNDPLQFEAIQSIGHGSARCAQVSEDFRTVLQSELRSVVKDVDLLLQRRIAEVLEEHEETLRTKKCWSGAQDKGEPTMPTQKTPTTPAQNIGKRATSSPDTVPRPREASQSGYCGTESGNMIVSSESFDIDRGVPAVPVLLLKSKVALQELNEARNEESASQARMTMKKSLVNRGASMFQRKSTVNPTWTSDGVAPSSEDMSSQQTDVTQAFSQSSDSRHKPNSQSKPTGEGRLTIRKMVVRSHSYELFVACLVTLNAISTGVQVNWMAEKITTDTPGIFRFIEVFFCIAFVLELSVRFIEYRWRLFAGADWHWNLFDCVLVFLHVLEEFISIMQDASRMPSMGVMRILRVMRLLRVMRFVRIMRLVSELRILLMAIGSCMKALLWTLVLIALIIYICSLVVTQITTDRMLENPLPTDQIADLTRQFGSVPRSALTLFQSITGADWQGISMPLDKEVGWWTNILFACYMGFMILAIMNVVTGVFVDSAIVKTKEHAELFMMNNVRDIFGDLGDEMNWQEFETKLEMPAMQRYFDFLDVDLSDARALFTLVDVDNSGSVDAEEFLTSCLRLKGPAKALDLQIVMREVGVIAHQQRLTAQMLERSLDIENGWGFKRRQDVPADSSGLASPAPAARPSY